MVLIGPRSSAAWVGVLLLLAGCGDNAKTAQSESNRPSESNAKAESNIMAKSDTPPDSAALAEQTASSEPPNSTTLAEQTASPAPPSFLVGSFEDDYGITYTIDAQTWTQYPSSTYNMSEWNPSEQYLIAQNDSSNSSAVGLWTRIDWMVLSDMEPYTWAFCLSAYEAVTAEEARNTVIADRSIPKTGCGGHPFSRMKITSASVKAEE